MRIAIDPNRRADGNRIPAYFCDVFGDATQLVPGDSVTVMHLETSGIADAKVFSVDRVDQRIALDVDWDSYREDIPVPRKLTRVDVIAPGNGRREHWADTWDISVQDDGRTMKLFAKGDGAAAQQERNDALAEDIQQIGESQL